MAVSTGFKQQCPSCESMVPIKDAAQVGKKIDCPKCKYRFVVEAPAADDAEDAEEAAPAKKAAPVKSSKGKPLPRRDSDEDEGDDDGVSPAKKKKAGSNTMLMVGGGIGGVAVILLIVAYATGMFGGGDTKKTAAAAVTKGDTKKSLNTTPPSENTNTASATGGGGGGNGGGGPPAEAAPPENGRDITNLLPPETKLVLNVNMDKLYNSPIGSRLYADETRTKEFVLQNLGVPANKVGTVLTAANPADGWSFTVVRFTTAIDKGRLKAALGVDPVAKREKKYEYNILPNNALVETLGAYFKDAVNELVGESQLKLFIGNPDRAMAAYVVDQSTLVVADESVMVQFLRSDMRPYERSVMGGAPAADPNNPGGPVGPGGPGGPPQGNPKPRPGGAAPGPGGRENPSSYRTQAPVRPGPPANPDEEPKAPTNRNERGQVFTSNPTYLTIDPDIKAMMNKMEELHKDPVAAMAFRLEEGFKIPSFGGIGPAIALIVQAQRIVGFGFDGTTLTKMPVVGVMLKGIDQKKFGLQALIDINAKDETVKKLADEIGKIAKGYITAMIESELGVKIGASGNGSGGGGGGAPGRGATPGAPGRGAPGSPGSPNVPNPQSDRIPNPGDGPPGALPPARPGERLQGRPRGTLPSAPPAAGGGTGGSDQSGSKVDISAAGRMMVLDVEIDWSRNIFDASIAGVIDGKVDQQRSKAVLLAQRAHWTSNRKPLAQFQKGSFPRGAYPRKSNPDRFGVPFPAEQRISWMAELLPALGYDSLSREIYRDLPWNHPSNIKSGIRWIPEFLSPAQPPRTWRTELPSLRNHELGATHFIGLSGIGVDAAEYPDTPEYAKKLGIFGYDRQTKFEDVKNGDGASNTIFMLQVAPNIPRPWIRGGGTTVQGVPEVESYAPFRAFQPDNRFGSYALMADGSVRFISSNISDDVFKALVTYKGGETIDQLDAVAAKEDPKAFELHALDRNLKAGTSVLTGEWRQQEIKEVFLRVKVPGAMTVDQIPDRRGMTLASQHCCPSRENPIFVVEVATPRTPLGYDSNNPAELDALVKGLEFEAEVAENVRPAKVGPKPVRRFELQRATGRYACQLFVSDRKAVVMYVKRGTVKDSDIDTFFNSIVLDEPKVALGWQNFETTISGTTAGVKMPGPPEQQSSAQDTFNKRFSFRERGRPQDLPLFEIFLSAGSEYPTDDFDGKKADDYVAALKAKPGYEVWAETPVKTNDLPGRQYKYRTTLKKKNASGGDEETRVTLYAERVYLFNNTLVIFRVANSDKSSEADVKKFLESATLSRAK